MRTSIAVAVFFLAACSGSAASNGGSGGAIGGAGGTGGAGGQGGAGGEGPRETWVADRILLPGDPTVTAFDLDGDGHKDDQLGPILQTLKQQGADFQPTVDAEVQDATIVQLVETHAGAASSVALLTGTPDSPACTTPGDPATCGQHLKGDAHFTAQPFADPPLQGTGTADAFEVGPGTVTIEASLLGSTVIPLPLLRARASFTRNGATLTGAVGGAIAQTDLHSKVFPAIAAGANQVIARDCPGGNCMPDSAGAKLEQLFDSDHNGTIDAAEIENNQLVKILFAPDIDTDGDQTPDALSAVFGLHLVGAVF